MEFPCSTTRRSTEHQCGGTHTQTSRLPVRIGVLLFLPVFLLVILAVFLSVCRSRVRRAVQTQRRTHPEQKAGKMKIFGWAFLFLAMALSGCMPRTVQLEEKDLFVFPLESGELAIGLAQGTFILSNPDQAQAGCYQLIYAVDGDTDGTAVWMGKECSEDDR